MGQFNDRYELLLQIVQPVRIPVTAQNVSSTFTGTTQRDVIDQIPIYTLLSDLCVDRLPQRPHQGRYLTSTVVGDLTGQSESQLAMLSLELSEPYAEVRPIEALEWFVVSKALAEFVKSI